MSDLTATPDRVTRAERVAGIVLAVGLLAGPAASHLYWALGGTWGLHRAVGGRIEESTTAGIRVVAAVVLVVVLAGVFVVLARVGLWRQTRVSDRVLRVLAWALAGVLLLEALAGFTFNREYEWWLYAPVSLVLGLLAIVVARATPHPPSRVERADDESAREDLVAERQDADAEGEIGQADPYVDLRRELAEQFDRDARPLWRRMLGF